MNLQDQALQGRISGQIDVAKFTDKPFISADLYSTNLVRFNEDTLGMFVGRGQYDVEKGLLTIDPSTGIQHKNNRVSLRGFYNTSIKKMSVVANLSNSNIAFVNMFIKDYVDQLKGLATGEIKVDGSTSDPSVSGDLVLNDVSLKVIYLGTRYKTNDIKFKFNNRNVTIDDFYLTDERGDQYKALVKGNITHKNFKQIRLNLTASSSDFLCLNTFEWDNDMFYGYVPAQLNATVKGLIDDIELKVDAKPLKGANFHLPLSSSGDASSYDYIQFVSLGKDQQDSSSRKTSTYFKIDMNIKATPDIEAFIILDRNTREQIVAKGNGDIHLKLDLGNSMEMFGTYTITEGQYEFNFRGVLPRIFQIDEGSKMTWNGDPLAASMDVTAIYRLPSPLPLYPLIQGLTEDDTEIAEAKKKYETFIYLSLKNDLSSPEIKFDIQQPSNRAISSMAYEKLNQIRNDDKELVSQAGVLLLLGEFYGSEGLSTGSYERGGVATASDLISNALSSGLTNVFSTITGLDNISLNLGYKQYALAENQANVNQFNFAVSANLFKDRVVVDFGSNVDVDRNNQTSRNGGSTNFGGDFKAQYLVTDDGRLRLNAYRTTTNINAEGNNVVKGGVGVTYKKVFNSIGDFFGGRRRKAKQAESTLKTE
jgi:hypothetical protein